MLGGDELGEVPEALHQPELPAELRAGEEEEQEEERLEKSRKEFGTVAKRSRPDEGFDDGDESFDVPGGVNHVEALQVLPQPVNTHTHTRDASCVCVCVCTSGRWWCNTLSAS